MKKYKKNIPPIISSVSSKYYVNDIVKNGDIIFPDEDTIRELIGEYRLHRERNKLNTITNIFGKFVLSIAKNYQENGLDLSDLISEGMLGLFTAIDKFNLNGDVKFITYSYRVISRAILEAIDYNKYIIKLPKNIRNDINKQRMSVADSKPVDKDMSNINSKKASDLETDKAFDTYTIYPKWEESNSLNIDIGRILNSVLTEQEKMVIQYKFGINVGFATNSLRQIGYTLNLSDEEIKNVYIKAITKLKDNKIKDILKKYLD